MNRFLHLSVVIGLSAAVIACDGASADSSSGSVTGADGSANGGEVSQGIDADPTKDAATVDATADAPAPADQVAPGDTTAPADQNAAADTGPSPGDAASGGTITIYVQGDNDPVTFADGLQGQTASNFEIALSRYHVLTGPADPSPQLCFDHGDKPAVLNMAGDNLAGSCQTAAVLTGIYTYGRVKVDWARYTVQGQLHYAGQTLPGKFTFLRAYSDTTVAGKAYAAGTGTLRFQDATGAVDSELPYVYPPLVPMPGITNELKAGEFTMTFAYKKALPILQGAAGQHWARFHWHVYQAFRWLDLPSIGGFSAGVWDVVPLPGVTESVVVPGVAGYHVTSSLD